MPVISTRNRQSELFYINYIHLKMSLSAGPHLGPLRELTTFPKPHCWIYGGKSRAPNMELT